MTASRISRRRFFQGLSWVGVGTVVAACTPMPAPTVTEEGVPAAEAIHIRFAGWGNTEELTLYENIAAAHMEEDSGIEIENLGFPGSDYAQKLFSWIASGDPPENLRTGTQYFPTLWADGVLLALTEYFNSTPDLLDDAQYMTVLYDIYTLDNEMFATVIGPNVMAAYLNMDMLSEAGLEYPGADWTYDDYAAMAVAMTGGEGMEKTFGSSNAYWWMVWESQLWARGGDLFDAIYNPTRCLLDSEEMIETCRWFQDMVHTHGAAPTAGEAAGFEGGWNSGRIGMEITGTWAVNARRKIDAFAWDLAHLPREKHQASAHAAGGIVIPNTVAHPDAAWSHAAYHQGDRAQEMYARDGLNAPIMLKWATSPAFLELEGAPPHHSARVDAMAYSRNRDFYFAQWTEVRNKAFNPEMDKLMTGEQTPEDTALNMAQKAQEILDA